MIVQTRREGHYRVFTQHDHGMQCGMLERALDPSARWGLWSLPIAMTVALHDLAWVDIDAWDTLLADDLPWDTKRAQPHDFTSMPSDIKAHMYARGIEELGRMHPYMGALLNAHYSVFFTSDHPFKDQMGARAQRWLGQAQQREGALPSPQQQAQHLELLRFLDMISLFACMRAPGANLLASPAWISHEWTCNGTAFHMRFHDPDTLVLTPTPFAQKSSASIPFKDICPQDTTPAAWLEAWRAAPWQQWNLTVE